MHFLDEKTVEKALTLVEVCCYLKCFIESFIELSHHKSKVILVKHVNIKIVFLLISPILFISY